MSKPPFLVFFAALNGFISVALGALGAHALKERLAEHGSTSAWQTASTYQLTHAIACLALLAWAAAQAELRPAFRRIVVCWLIGSLLFSGSLYALALGAPRFFGPITPLGGVAFLAGWALLAIEGLRRPASA